MRSIMRFRGIILVVVTIVYAGFASVTTAQPAAAQNQPERQLPPEVAAGNAAFQRQDWNVAIENYRKAISGGNNSSLIHMRLGYALHVLGKYEEALPSHLRAAAATHPEIRIDGLYNAACASALLGKTDAALEYFAKAIDAGFKDKAQVEKDTDLASLRDDERFKKLVAGIGTAPRLHQQLDFLIGEWTQTNEAGEVVDTLTISRPLAGSHALLSTSVNIGGGQWTGMLWPDAEKREWRSIQADGLGTSREMIGRAIDGGGMVFTGHDISPVGPGVHLRLTFTPQSDSKVLEKAEVSEDGGATWRTHHESAFVKRSTTSTN